MKKQWIDLTVAILGRAPSEEELSVWWHEEATLLSVAGALQGEAAAQERFVFGGDDTDLVTSAYEALFDRMPDEEGLAYWLTQMEQGALDQASLIPALLAGARAPSGGAADAELINLRLEVATNYVSQLESGDVTFSIAGASSVVAEVTREGLNDQPLPPSDAIVVDLDRGTVVESLQKESVFQDGVSAVVISEQEIERFEQSLDTLFDSAVENVGTILTFTTGSEVLELVTIDFIGQSELRDLGSEVGYTDFIDLALLNGELVTPSYLDISPEEFFVGESEIFEYFGYSWPWVESGPEVISREDGESFTVEIEVLDTLGIANANEIIQSLFI